MTETLAEWISHRKLKPKKFRYFIDSSVLIMLVFQTLCRWSLTCRWNDVLCRSDWIKGD